jgi:hypothetical protein
VHMSIMIGPKKEKPEKAETSEKKKATTKK